MLKINKNYAQKQYMSKIGKNLSKICRFCPNLSGVVRRLLKVVDKKALVNNG